MAHPTETRLALRTAFINGLSLKLAAERVGVPLETARNWQREAQKAGEDWDKQRNIHLLAAGGGIEQAIGRSAALLVAQCESTVEWLAQDDKIDPLTRTSAISSATDSLNKLAAVATRLMPQANRLAIETEAVKALANLLIRLHPKLAGEMLSTVEAWANGQR